METDATQTARKYVLAIDLGSGGPKVGIIDSEGQVIASARESTPIYFLEGGGVEQDTADWWNAVSKAVRQVLSASKVPPESILAVAVTGQWSVTVAIDQNGEALMNAVSWMDHRGGKYNQELVKGFPNIAGYGLSKLTQFLRHAGMPPGLAGSDVVGHISFIRNERPEVYKRTDKFLDAVDYINFRLTGKCAATKNTLFAYGLTDIRKLDLLEYDPSLLKLTGIDQNKLPTIMPVDGILGAITPSTANELGLSPKTIVICGANDNSIASIGAGAIADFEAAAVMGTSGMLCFHVPFKKTDVMHTVATMPSAFRGRYMFWSDLGNNGKVLDSYLSNLIYWEDETGPAKLTPQHYAQMNKAASEIQPGSDGLLFLPWFNGSLSPSEDPYMRGGFINMSNRTTRKHLTRAMLEGLSFNWRWLKEVAEHFNGKEFPYWRITGGGAISEVWCQIMADVVGIPMHQQADPYNNTVLGIAFLAFIRLGVLSLADIPKIAKISRVFEPRQENRLLYDKLYQQFSAAYKNNRPIFHSLNK